MQLTDDTPSVSWSYWRAPNLEKQTSEASPGGARQHRQHRLLQDKMHAKMHAKLHVALLQQRRVGDWATTTPTASLATTTPTASSTPPTASTRESSLTACTTGTEATTTGTEANADSGEEGARQSMWYHLASSDFSSKDQGIKRLEEDIESLEAQIADYKEREARAMEDTQQVILPRISYSITTSPLKPGGSSGPHTPRRPVAALSCHSAGAVFGTGVSAGAMRAGPTAAATPTPASPRPLPLAHAHAHAHAQANGLTPIRGSVALEASACTNGGGGADAHGGGGNAQESFKAGRAQVGPFTFMCVCLHFCVCVCVCTHALT
jgi:hypothetical protein